MCSISGIFSVGPRNPDLIQVVQRMNLAQAHRGPDDRGISRSEFHTGEVVLGNTRLAIIDTSSAGHQPMNDPLTGNRLTYNGETYNFLDLRKEIDDDSEPWLSRTDTEVVLRAYRKWGVAAFQKLRGMFALSIWDQQKEELVLARDPLGIKPLYYYVAKNYLLFASELRALLASGLVPQQLSSAGLDSYLGFGSVESPLTIVAGVKQLLPGHCLRVRADKAGKLEIFDLDFACRSHARIEVTNRNEAAARLRAELEESVRRHLLSDVPLGVFLSGGMDSSALVALMSRVSTQRPKTFSVVFDEARFSEAPYSRAVAELFQTRHFEIRLNEHNLIKMLPEAIAAVDHPTMDGINTFVISRSVKQAGVTVALSGLGGDELFAGYPSFRRAVRLGSMSPLSKQLVRAASGLGKTARNGSPRWHKFWELANSNGRPADVYRISRQLFSTFWITQMTGSDIRCLIENNGHRHEGDTVNEISRLELKRYMANTLLRDTDVMSMAHSLEVRVPFVDVKVVEYVLSLPGEWKLPAKNPRPKPLLADALTGLLPQGFMKRPKMGFTLPFEKWLQRDLRAEVASVLKNAQALAVAGLNVGPVARLWDNFLEKPRAVGWSRPWSLYVLARWCEVNGVRT